MLQNFIDEAEGQGLVRTHELVPLHVLEDEVQGLLGVLDVDLVQLPFQFDDLLCLNLDVRRLTAGAAGWLMHHAAKEQERDPQHQKKKVKGDRPPPFFFNGALAYILALGRECLMPGDPAAKRSDPMEAAWPTHQVEMGGRTYCMVS